MAESPAELAARRSGDPYLTYADNHERQHVVSLSSTWDRAAIGRSPNVDLVLSWDGQVSTIHAELTRIGDDWLLVDDGLSRNGSFVNGERLSGRRRLRDGDKLRFGSTVITFHAPFQLGQETIVGHEVKDLRPD
jgi:pSer/pThr/pTyr-binding forkhead associated (FHA) protein